MNHRFLIVAGQHRGTRQALADDRRDAERFPVWPEQVQIRTTLAAELKEESFNGIGLVVDDASNLKVGQTIEIEDAQHAQPVQGVIAHLTSTEDGKWKIGIKLDESHVPI